MDPLKPSTLPAATPPPPPLATAWLVDPLTRLYQIVLPRYSASREDLISSYVTKPANQLYDCDNRLCSFRDGIAIYVHYSTYRSRDDTKAFDNEQMNMCLTRALLDKTRFETAETWPSVDVVQDCVYGAAVLYGVDLSKPDHPTVCHLPQALLEANWPLLFCRDPPYQLFGKALVERVGPDAARNPAASTQQFDNQTMITEFLREPIMIGSDRQQVYRVKLVHFGAYLYLHYMAQWQRFAERGSLQFYLVRAPTTNDDN